MAITIYNKDELEALSQGRFILGDKAGTSVTEISAQIRDERNSGDDYAGIMNGGVDTLELELALSDVNTFDNNVTPDNEIFSPDYVNNRVEVLIPCRVNCGLIFQGEWASNVDVTFELWVVTDTTPYPGIKHPAWEDITQSGSGAGRRVDMFKERAIPMGAQAPWNFDFSGPVYIYLRAKASSASTTVSQVYIQMSPEYGIYSARDI
jgi:hypothetical protein